jgi:STE24 endopeptidase
VPVLLILLARDMVFLLLWSTGQWKRIGAEGEPFVLVVATAMVFVFAPAILRHVLRTEPLPDGHLRRRLEEMCRRTRLRYQDILLWHTDLNMGNAAVMGILPRLRYILLSDLLLETMSDEQIEAVFAHEIGHVVHRHMAWYVVFVIVLMVAMAGPGSAIEERIRAADLPAWIRTHFDAVAEAGAVILFLFSFGYLSRRFERQADVYAARTIESILPLHDSRLDSTAVTSPLQTPVGIYGAAVFNSALRKVALVNNIPIGTRRRFTGNPAQRLRFLVDYVFTSANNWLHGSIAQRMRYLQKLAGNPLLTARFDRGMLLVNLVLLGALIISGLLFWSMRSV